MVLRAIRSALFLVWFLSISVVMHILALPLLLGPRSWLAPAMVLWARLSLFGLKWLAGLGHAVRGAENIPRGAALVAVKHYTMWETIAVLCWLPDPAVVVKRQLLSIPFYGWYLRRAGMIALDREAGGRAVRGMAREAKRAAADGRQIVIFPEGTRRRVGDPPAYKPGVAALYAQLGVPCVPVAHNSGLFWKPFLKMPGTVVVEFLPPIPSGLDRATFMARLEHSIEPAAGRLTGGAAP